VNQPYFADVDDGMDVRDLLAKIMARRWWLLGSVLFCAAIFSAAAFLLTPIYRASTILIPSRSEKDLATTGASLGGIGTVASLVGINLGGGDSLTEEALAVLKSRQFTEKFIDERQLMPVLYSSKWDAQSGKWKIDENSRPTPAKAYRYFDKSIRSITQDKKTGLITLNIDWSDRVMAADWANDLVRRLNVEMRQREMARDESAVGYLEKELQSTAEVATREAIGRLIEGQVKQRMLATVTPEFAFRVIDRAMAPDRDDRYSPRRLLILAAGPVVGLFVGVFWILIYSALTTGPKTTILSPAPRPDANILSNPGIR
jgi:uncharacterized protein involved in exopolysaccharide biosynthesis